MVSIAGVIASGDTAFGGIAGSLGKSLQKACKQEKQQKITSHIKFVLASIIKYNNLRQELAKK
jgi:hypothetical protein